MISLKIMKNLFKQHQSLIFALSITLLLSTWLISGYFRSSDEVVTEQVEHSPRSLIQKVRVRVPEMKRVSQEVVLYGRTEPSREITLRSEVEGRVIKVAAIEGAVVPKGRLILQLDNRDRKARLAEANALLKQHELEYSGAKKLQQQNLQSEIFLARIASQLATARAQVERIELEIRNTRIVAPFDGILDQLPVDVGTYLQAGDEMAHLIEQDPIIFVGYVSQLDRQRLVLGDKGIVRFVTGQVEEGELRYLAAESDQVTRTFKAEFEIPNPDGSLISGITAQLHIPVRFVSAYQLSPALLSLSPSDLLGVKVVNEEDRVEFIQVEVIKSTADGLWITGLNKGARVITVGHGFVRAGDQVIPVDEGEINHKVAAE